jgi:tetratricopeptide (TPR) repeat protein
MRAVLLALALATGCLTAGAARAEEPAEEIDHDDTIGGKRPKTVVAEPSGPVDNTGYAAGLARHQGKEFPAVEMLGAEWLGLQPVFLHDTRVGIEQLYRGDYKAAKAHFDSLGIKYRGSGVAPVGQLLIWQALMIENFDFRYDSQYRNSYKISRQELQQALLVPGNEAWEYFLQASVLGVDAIHLLRKEEWVTAVGRGYEALKSVEKVRQLAPRFVDVQLGDGLFNYWTTVISMSTKSIPDTGDNRQKGIAQMRQVEQQGIFLGPAATLGLTFTWIEEGKNKTALECALRNHKAYPSNVINTLILGRVYSYNRAYPDAERVYKEVVASSPNNQRVHYYLGLLYLRWNKLPEAEASLDRYLAFTDLSPTFRASALYYKGALYQRKQDIPTAKKYYQDAVRIGKMKRAQQRLDKLAKQGK